MTFALTAKTQTLLDIFNAAGVLVDDASIEVNEQGLSFRGMDPSHTAMLDVQYPPTEFAAIDGSAKLGIRIQEILKILKRFDRSGEMTLTESDSMLILKDSNRQFKNRLVEAIASSTPLPKLGFDAKSELDRSLLSQALADVRVVSEFVRFHQAEKLVVSGEGDGGEVSIDVDGATTTTKQESKALYSLDYLEKMVKAVNTDKAVIEFSSKKPIKLTVGHITYYLAPRVQE